MQALILAGGSGTRFWPASRRRRPKQLLSLVGERTLLRATYERLAPIVEPADVWVCTHTELAALVAAELPEVPAGQILAEPAGRNTAPAIAWSLASMPAARRGEAVVSLHSDHWIEDEDAFRASLLQAVAAVEERDLVIALGVAPRWAETGYGYMEAPAPATPHGDLREVVCFLEKPDRETAERFAASGHHFWNSGIFVFQASTLLGHLETMQPALMSAIADILDGGGEIERIYPSIGSQPIDTAVMERLDTMHTVVLDCGWSDLGSWQALAEVLGAGANGNVVRGDAVAVESQGNLLFASSGTIAVLGVEGLAVVRTGDAVLVAPLERSQDVRRIVAELERREREDLL